METIDTTAVALAEEKAVEQQAPPTTLDQFIIRGMTDPAFDVAKMQELLLMRERIQEGERRTRFHDALAVVQAQMPQIDQNGLIDYKTEKGKIPYAKLEDIDVIIRPIYSGSGFSVSWDSKSVFDGKMIEVTGSFSAFGHTERRTLTLPPDGSGGKNGTQAVASSVAYAKRHLLKMFFNLIERGADKDGAKMADLQPITQDQADTIRGLLSELTNPPVNMPKFYKLFGVEKIEELKAGKLKAVHTEIEAAKRRQK